MLPAVQQHLFTSIGARALPQGAPLQFALAKQPPLTNLVCCCTQVGGSGSPISE